VRITNKDINPCYHADLAIIADTIFYISYYFNYKLVQEYISEYNWSEKGFFKYYNVVNFEIDERIRPFFDLHNKEASFFYTYFTEHYNFKDSLNGYLSKIIIQDLKDEFIRYYQDNKIKVCDYKEIDSIIDILFHQVEEVGVKISLLHQHYLVNKRLFYKFVDSEVYMRVQSNEEIVDYYNPIGFISYIKPFGINKIENNGRNCLAVGIDYMKFQEDYSKENLNFLNINKLGEIYSNPIKTNIIYLIHKHGALTSRQIADLLNIGTDIIYKAINSLQYFLVLNCKEKSRKIYYSVNPEFFSKADKVAFDFNNFINDRRISNVEETKDHSDKN
jgi:hypothetical protein